MNLTTTGEYASRAVLDLVMHYEQRPARIEDIARRQHIPKKYLEQVLLALKKAGLVHSVRGREGGYQLARPPEEIMLGEVIQATDGPLFPVPCLSQTVGRSCICPNPDTCGLRTVWMEVRDAIAKVLDHTSMAQIRQRCEQLQFEHSSMWMYHI